MNALDLYAKIEPMIGFYEEYEKLYDIYIDILKSLKIKKVLDIGCGNGRMLVKLKNEKFEALGIERSSKMVKNSLEKGVNAKKIDLCDIKGEFDALIGVGDVFNYMDEKELKSFFECSKRVLKKGGFFIGDINTLFGFEEITQGVMIKEQKERFLAIEALFEDEKLYTDIFLFEKNNNCYKKEYARIVQYFYSSKRIEKLSRYTLWNKKEIKLFSDIKSDKEILILKNV